MILDHCWRPLKAERGGGVLARPCAYMSCRRPRAEHQRAVSGRWAQ